MSKKEQWYINRIESAIWKYKDEIKQSEQYRDEIIEHLYSTKLALKLLEKELANNE